MNPQRTFTPSEDALLLRCHAGELPMRQVRVTMTASYAAMYRRLAEMGLGKRKPDARRPGCPLGPKSRKRP